MMEGQLLAVTAAEMREMDRLTIERHGVSGKTLMERAGRGVTDIVLERFGKAARAGVVIVAGKGNNGGDALVVARLLRRKRIPVTLFRPAERGFDLGRMIDSFGGAGLVVDGLFGTGLRPPLDDRSVAIIEAMNAAPCPIVAIDVPSGLDADRGMPLEAAVQAALTVTFAFPKVGLLLHPGASFAGDVAVFDIGIAEAAVRDVDPRQSVLGPSAVASAVPARAADTHKGSYGHVLVIGGSTGKMGAASLAARAALRSGAGLVTVASTAAELSTLVLSTPEIMTARLGTDPTDLLDGKTSVVVGPGLGVSADASRLVERLIATSEIPIVIDADALNCLAADRRWLRERRAPIVLTPHPGEMARLVSRPTEEVQANRMEFARELAREDDVTVVLKGSRTLVADPTGRLAVNPTGNPGMASGGMGDALSGIVGTIAGQVPNAFAAACAGVFWHGFAGDRVAVRKGEAGLLASDLIEELPSALRSLQDFVKEPVAASRDARDRDLVKRRNRGPRPRARRTPPRR